jgi:hypothetical protein
MNKVKNIQLLYQRLGLTPSSTLMLITHYERIKGGNPPSDRSCRMFCKGEIVPKNGFNHFLSLLDGHIDMFIKEVFSNHKPNKMTLVGFNNSDELWQQNESMFGCPIELYNAMINRFIVVAKLLGISINVIFAQEDEIQESDWFVTYNLSLPIDDVIYEALSTLT